MKCTNCGTKLPKNTCKCTECGCENISVAPKNKKPVKIVISVVASILLLAVLAEAVHLGITGRLWPYANDIYYHTNYSTSDETAIRDHDVVVATLGENTLTRGQLQMFYWMTVYTSLNNNEGAKYNVPFDQQIYDKKTGKTWQQYFLEGALETWRQYQVFANEAKKANYEMPEDSAKELADLEKTVQEAADETKAESAEAFLASRFGAGCTFEDYYYFMELYYISSLYFDSVVSEMKPSDEDIEAFFKLNEESLAASGYTKDKGLLVDVRHILIMPHNDAVDENSSNATYTDEDWENCRKEAQEIYDKWLAGDASEGFFSMLAAMYSKDFSASDGGLYEAVAEGEMVTEFNDWCFAEGRKPGDHGMVKTKFGYHVMYYSGDQMGWLYFCRRGVREDMATAYWENILADKTPDINYRQISLADVKLA